MVVRACFTISVCLKDVDDGMLGTRGDGPGTIQMRARITSCATRNATDAIIGIAVDHETVQYVAQKGDEHPDM